ncbi:MAG: SDR family NAD(P)-dependent oxidoreductase [Bacteroidales bacterium]
MKKIIIMGATSGIGLEVCKHFIEDGWKVGIAGRREERLKALAAQHPKQIIYKTIDICSQDASEKIDELIEELGGIDYYFHVSGIGDSNEDMDIDIEIKTMETNTVGFSRSVITAFNYFKTHGGGHIGVISSLAGMKGLGAAPAYSATKRFNMTYVQALSQKAHMNKYHITFTDIRPGFIKTDILNSDRYYPILLELPYASKIIYKALIKKKRYKYIDWRFAIIAGFWKLIPNRLWEKLNIKNMKTKNEKKRSKKLK